MRYLIILFVLAVTLSLSIAAQPVSSPSPTAATVSPLENNNAPVAVPEPTEKAMAYYRSGVWLWAFNLLWGMLIPALFLFTGFSAKLRSLAQRLGKKWFLVLGIYFALFSLISFLIDLPLSYYQDFARQHEYGLSNQTFGKWLGDATKGLFIGIVTGALFLWVPYLLLKKSPQRWWLWTGVAAIPFVILGILITPIWIDPLFNKFGAMQNKTLEAKILALADRAGIEGSRVFEVAKSEDTKMLNAYVTGFANTKRIVLWDTIIARLDENELLSVMGHEMGHYVLGHVWRTLIIIPLLLMLMLYLIHRTAGWLIDRYRNRFGFNQLSDIASLPLLLLLLSFYSLFLMPVMNAYSQYNEHEADRFGLEILQNNRAAANAFVKLQTDNLANPRPGWLMKVMRATHPPIGERIDFCNSYRPWQKNEPLVYGHLFRQPQPNERAKP